jgi:hypothetical protein
VPNGTQSVKPWSEIAANFDPLMDAKTYDDLRLHYFNSFVAPRVPKEKSVEGTWGEFKKLTERPQLLSGSAKLALHGQVAAASAADALLAPLKDLHPEFRAAHAKVQARELDLGRMAAREGMNTKPAAMLGSFAGQAVDFGILTEVLGPMAAGIAAEITTTARATALATKVLRGGLAFATYDALSAEQGNRLMSGLKGFGVGAAFDLALGTPGYLQSRGVATGVADAEKIVAEVNAGHPRSTAVDEFLATKAKHDAEISRLELRPEKPSWQYTLGSRGARVHVKDISGQVIPLDIRTGREYDTYRQLRAIVEQGGSVSHYELHPDDSRALNEFIRIQTAAEESKYRGTVIRTAPGQAEKVASASAAEGMPATALSKDTVEVASVPVEHPIMNKPAVVDIPRMPERRPSAVEVDQALEKKKELSSKNREFIRYHFDKVWDENLEWEDKRSSMVILGRHAPELLPESMRAKMPPMDPTGKVVKQVVEARVQAAASRALGWSVNIEHIGKSGKGKVVVTMATNLSDQMVNQLENALGPEYEVYVPKALRAGTRAEEARLARTARTDEQVKELLDFHNVKPEEVDIEAVRAGGEAELVRQLEVKRPELYGKRKSVPKAQASILDHVPPSEQREFKSVKDGIRAGDQTHSLVQDAMDAGGQSRFLGSPAGRKSVATQVTDASLTGRLIGSIEDVSPNEIMKAGAALSAKGWKVVPIRGYMQGKFELLYFREADMARVAPLIQDYDNFVSQQAGRIYNSDGMPTADVGEAAHARLGRAFGIGERDLESFQSRRVGGVRPAPEVQHKPYGNRFVIQHDDMQRMYPGAAGLAHPSFEQFAKDLGVDLPPSLHGGDPLVVLTPEVDKKTVWHERLHVNGMYAGTYEDFPTLVSPDHQQTALELAKGLSGAFAGYAKIGTRRLIEEAFTHAAEAVRFGDRAYLEHLARYDRTVDHVVNFVYDTANNLLERTFRRADNVPIRIFQRTLWDLMRRSSPEVSESLRAGSRVTSSGIGTWYDSGSDSWVLKDTPGSEVRFKDIHDLWDHLTANDKSFMAPSASLRPELGGVRGPVVPNGREPDGSPLPMPELPPEGRYVGMSAASALWRPFFPWVATLHESMNDVWKAGGKYLPLYEKAKAVDDQFRVGDAWLQKTYEDVHGLLEPFKGKKMQSVFDYLTYPEAERTGKVMEKYGLTQGDAQQAHKVWEFMKAFSDETGINLKQYMLEYHPKLRGFGWAPERVFGQMTTLQSASFWDRMIRHEGRWDPQDAHLGRFLHVSMREGMEKKFTGKALDEFEKLIGRKTQDGTYVIPQSVRWPLDNYAKYMRGIPDTSTQVINKTMGEFFGKVNDRIKELNKSLPAGAQIPEMTSPPRQVLQRFMLMSYTMGLGLRPAIAIRDMMQAFTGGLTVLGPNRFSKAFTRFMMNPRESLEFADKAGALLRKNNIGELYGDIMQEVPNSGPGWMDRVTRWSNALLAPSRWGHNFGRAIMFTGEYGDALEGIRAYRAGKLTVDQLTESTTLWFMDKPAQSNLLRYISNTHVPAEDAAAKVALEAVDLTQWPYRRGTQPTLLRYGAGRIFGQYGVWPANYADFLYRIGRKWSERPDLAARTSATWVAVNYALTHAMEAAGADTSKWFWQSPAGFAGSPHWDFVHAVMVAPENTEEGHAARRTILEYPLNFVPAMSEMKSVAKAIQDGGVNSWPPDQASLLRAMGFKPIDQAVQDQDWQDFVKTQMGYESARRRR